MKKAISKIIVGLSLVGLMVISGTALADAPPDPGGDPNGTGGGTPVGGSPVGSGLAILISLGIAYGGKKVYFLREDK